MVTIAGNGMGKYDFANLDIDLNEFDKVLCDTNFLLSGKNILKLRFREIKEYLLENYEKENLLYVVTGSPFFYSGGSLLASKLPKDKVKIINNTSSKEYMIQKLSIQEEKLEHLSMHGRKYIDLTKFLSSKYTLILCDSDSIEKIAKALKYLHSGDVEVTIGYKLGYEDEIIQKIDITDVSSLSFDFSKPYVLMIKRLYELSNGLSNDEDFETERGMITKKYKRQLSLQNLDLEPNQLLWDVGAGSGSCGIEAYSRYKTRVVFFEKNKIRCQNIQKNLANHKVVDCELLSGEAGEKFTQLEVNPQRIFIGGGGEEVIQKLPYLYKRLSESGVMLISAITLKHLNSIITILSSKKIKYEVISLSLTTYKGELDLIEPQRQLFQIKVQK